MIIKNELLKLVKKRSNIVIFVIYCIGLVGSLLGYILGENAIGLNIFTKGQYMGWNLSLMMQFLLPFVTLFLISTSFVYEINNGTLKNIQLLPVKRERIYLSKLLAVQSIIGILLVSQFVLGVLVSVVLDGGIGLSIIGGSILEYLSAFIVLGIVNLLGAILSLLLKSTGLTIIIAYVGYIGMNILGMFSQRFSMISPTRIINDYQNLFNNKPLNQLLIIGAYYIMLIAVGILYFDKKEENLCQ